uniref:V-type proton ATPase subunit C n=1 Tax=Monodelphis domestica TaxID=13616 RepID=A0A5F8HFD5_MONDO
MSEFWLISIPGDEENLRILERMKNLTSKANLCRNSNFAIPDFKVGTLDSLISLSDELGKLDHLAESLVKRMVQCVIEQKKFKNGEFQEYLLVTGVSLASFVTHFEWDMARYSAQQPLWTIVDKLGKQLTQMETDLKTRISASGILSLGPSLPPGPTHSLLSSTTPQALINRLLGARHWGEGRGEGS